MPLIQAINFQSPDPKLLSHAADLLRAGKIVAFPTDTSYGLAVDPRNSEAVEHLFASKRRSRSKAIPILISNIAMLETLTSRITALQRKAIQHFWPGPLTMIFDADKKLPPNLRANQPTVAIRYPNSPLTLLLIKAFGDAITATSANLSGAQTPALVASQIADDFGTKLSLILDAGKRPEANSTIVDLRQNKVEILRPGILEETEIVTSLDPGRLK